MTKWRGCLIQNCNWVWNTYVIFQLILYFPASLIQLILCAPASRSELILRVLASWVLPGSKNTQGHTKKGAFWKRNHPKWAWFQMQKAFYNFSNIYIFLNHFFGSVFMSYNCAKSYGDCKIFPLYKKGKLLQKKNINVSMIFTSHLEEMSFLGLLLPFFIKPQLKRKKKEL